MEDEEYEDDDYYGSLDCGGSACELYACECGGGWCECYGGGTYCPYCD